MTDTKGYIIGGVIGSGAYGVVVQAKHPDKEEDFAIKLFGYLKKKPDMNYINQEIKILTLLREVPGVVTLKDTFDDLQKGIRIGGLKKVVYRKYPAIVTERLTGGTLLAHLSNDTKFTEFRLAMVFKSFIETLGRIHACGIINCDIKPENIMLACEGSWNVKIIDFGLAVHLTDECVEHRSPIDRGTPAFIAPETIQNRARGEYIYSRQTDLWQAACVLYCLLTGCFPFGILKIDSKSNFSEVKELLYQRIETVSFIIPPGSIINRSRESIDLLEQMFRLNPEERLSIDQILQHKWLSGEVGLNQYCFGREYHNLVESLRNNDIIGNGIFRSQHRRKGALLRQLESPRSFKCESEKGFEFTEFEKFDINPACLANLRGEFIRLADMAPMPSQVLANINKGRGDKLRREDVNDGHDVDEAGERDEEEDYKEEEEVVEDVEEEEEEEEEEEKEKEEEEEEDKDMNFCRRLFKFEGLGQQEFNEVVSKFKLHHLYDNSVIFGILDWNHSGTVDYLEFMVALQSLLNDDRDMSEDAMADTYFDVFNVLDKYPVRMQIILFCLEELIQHITPGFQTDYTLYRTKEYVTKEDFREMFKRLLGICQPLASLVSRSNSLAAMKSQSGSMAGFLCLSANNSLSMCGEIHCADIYSSRLAANATSVLRDSLLDRQFDLDMGCEATAVCLQDDSSQLESQIHVSGDLHRTMEENASILEKDVVASSGDVVDDDLLYN